MTSRPASAQLPVEKSLKAFLMGLLHANRSEVDVINEPHLKDGSREDGGLDQGVTKFTVVILKNITFSLSNRPFFIGEN